MLVLACVVFLEKINPCTVIIFYFGIGVDADPLNSLLQFEFCKAAKQY